MTGHAWTILAAHLALFAPSLAFAQFCSAPNRIEWPAGRPVWTLCWVNPEVSSGPDGSGLELRHVFYRGKRVFWRANVPVLNVLYDAGTSCGPTYRDWLNDLQAFEANNPISPGYSEPTQPPVTVCNAPGSDVGSFSGVAAEKLADRLIITTQTRAGWYRYVQKITFHLDGRIEPYIGFTAVQHPCINQPHSHHGYWRFDFDIDGAANDVIRERRRFLWFFNYWSTRSTEEARLRTASHVRHWRVLDRTTQRGFEIVPGHGDAVGGDAFGGSDAWLLQYRFSETDDGGATAGAMGDAQHIDPFVNGESIAGRDVVLWYRVGHRHESGPTCGQTGPLLVPVGAW